jgi:NIPSNAP protein
VDWQLRIYEIEPGQIETWIEEWREHVVPLRRSLGFRVLGGWVDGTTFVWLLGYDGEDGFAAADARYYASAERRSVEPDPARHIVSSESRMLREVPQ